MSIASSLVGKRLGHPLLVAWVKVGVVLFHHASVLVTQEIRDFLHRSAVLCQPAGSRVAEGVRRRPFQASSPDGRCKGLLDGAHPHSMT